jgi:membrane-bound lytic murein transglycosylase A
VRRWLGIAASALAASACAQTYPYVDSASPTAAVPSSRAVVVSLADLPGWRDEDHVAALAALRAACQVAHDAAFLAACARAPTGADEAEARDFLAKNFEAVAVSPVGRLTGYFMPVYDARASADDTFSAPVRPRPADLPPDNLSAAGHAPYADRAEIEARPAPDALAWMRPEDLFFMQIQGAGVLVFPDGTRTKAVFAGTNGTAFVGIAQPMRQRGMLSDQDTSAGAIHAWLADHRGPDAAAIMDLDPRYVFYSLTADDGLEPFGAAGARLPAGRAVAVDPAWHAMGELLWIDGETPTLAGAFPSYRRLVAALDTGGAIKGEVRADLYLGRGPAAGQEAGRIRHTLTLWRLTPK